MSASDYRAKAAQYEGLSGRTDDFATARRYKARARSYTQLADNEQWLADHPGAHFSAPATPKTTADETAASEGGRSTAGAMDRVNSNIEEVTPMTTSNQPNQASPQQNQGGQQGGQQQGGQDQKSGQQTQNPGQGGQQGDQKPAQPSQPQK